MTRTLEELGRIARQWREADGYSQITVVARARGILGADAISEPTYRAIESGRGNPTSRTLRAASVGLCRAPEALEAVLQGADPNEFPSSLAQMPAPDSSAVPFYAGPSGEQLRWALDPIKERDDRQDDRLDDHEARIRRLEDLLATEEPPTTSPAVLASRRRRAQQAAKQPTRMAADTGDTSDPIDVPKRNRPGPRTGQDDT